MHSTLTGLGLAMALLAVPAQAAESEIGETSITIGYTSWSSSTSITALGKLLLEDIGYTVELKQLDTGLIYQALSTGAVDTFFSAWMPGQQSYLNKLGDKIDIIGTASGPAPGGLVVPGYVDINSIEELKDPEVMASLGGKILGIDAGAGLMMQTKEVMAAYEIPAELVTSSGAAMAAAFKTAYEKNEPIVVTGWCPTPMCAKYNLKFLADPKNIYGDARNWTVANSTFREDHPRAARFLARFTLFEKQMSRMLVWIDEDGMTPEDAAQRFVEENPEVIWYMIGDLGTGFEKPASLN
ncbi:glycine betaine ABC transporter substrate-binding protein [Rhodobacter sp. 24-YEA-8]|uniref:glycine betaine ABC transporter substrate-binding protein n=1 Tax=Rhodobacter sp. 24-YEA-8 TaxID=1884310 RepID=UPI000894DEED|nr:glycine betaine ABC transporter substrate-binding protein [Rhodobacter sp. 24-YEA-8]SED45089.1 glycine betaine/proline transport system substrate-binding protein [Rhodobacter sp. 24-YEA-8]